MTAATPLFPLGAPGILRPAMADLEEHAFRRDKRFIVRLVVLLAIGVCVGLLVAMKMTSPETAGCATRGFGTVTTHTDGGS